MSTMTCTDKSVPAFDINPNTTEKRGKNATQDNVFTLAPELFDEVLGHMKDMPAILLRKYDNLLKATKHTIFDSYKTMILTDIYTTPEMYAWVDFHLSDFEDIGFVKEEKIMLRSAIKSFLVKEFDDPLSINPKFGTGGRPYMNPLLSKSEVRAECIYLEARYGYESGTAREYVNQELDLLFKKARVRAYSQAVNILLVSESRHAPVTRTTETNENFPCHCDKKRRGIVRISGCKQCCVNMPENVSACTCKPHWNLWDGYEGKDLMCNHPGQFDPYKFSMTYFKGHVCSICSKDVHEDCEHHIFAKDALELYQCDVENHSSIEHVKERIASFDEEEAYYQTRKKEKRSRQTDDYSSQSEYSYDSSGSEDHSDRKRMRVV